MTPPLREGFTTGTAATAAATAALHLALTGQPCAECRVVLPPFPASLAPNAQLHPNAQALSLTIPILRSAYGYGYGCPPVDQPTKKPLCTAWAEVEKDGGDDPDATRHAHLVATVILPPSPPDEQHAPSGPSITIGGGTGVGRVTLAGLPVAVGQAAINPVPMQQITYALTQLARQHNYTGPIEVCIAVPHGEKLARRTLNARLGIVGGISILGTQGTVKPFSHSAWKATISQGLNVAAACHCQQICLSTGRRSERLLMGLYPELPAQAFIQAADFVQFSLAEAGQRPFTTLVWGCFFGKLLKLAAGHPYTHAHKSTLDLRLLSACCAEYHAPCAPAIAHCVTAGHALELLLDDSAGMDILHHVARQAALHARLFAGKDVRIHLFHIQGQELLAL